MLISLVAAGALSPAQACGGFFCNRDPIDQSGEDVVFEIDKEGGTTTVHVQIDYTGPAESFAWIVPTPNVPTPLLSSDRLFSELAWRTQPQFNLAFEELFECDQSDRNYGYGYYDFAASSSSTAPAPSEGGTVVVINEATVGPYDTVTLQAQTAEGLLDWLQLNGYDLPDNLDPVLQPYIADRAYFMALKLRKDTAVGALQPIALQYEGTGASIPIQLTSIAATPDMRLKVYLVGDSRAVPDSYLHVHLNDLVIDWFDGGRNYEDAITIAANEAGGQAFATDYAGSTDVMADALWRPGQVDIAQLAASPDAYAFFDRMLQMGFVGDAQMLELFREFLPIPEGSNIDEQSFYNCLSCYTDIVDQIPFDAGAFAAAIDERIVTPLRDAQKMFDRHPMLSRMTSSVSPVEMTVDPTFVFNADMTQQVSQTRGARVQMLCGFGGSWDTSPRRLVLADERAYDLPSERWFRNNDMTEYEYLADLMTSYAIVIEDTSDSGEPTILVDHRDQARAEAEAFNNDNEDGSMMAAGCGCNGAGGKAALLLAPLALIAMRRRRS